MKAFVVDMLTLFGIAILMTATMLAAGALAGP